MKFNKLIIAAVTSMMCLTASAQSQPNKDYTPKKGDFTLAATVGYNSCYDKFIKFHIVQF